MRLYSRTGATAITDPATGTVYEPGPDGGFDLPEEFAAAQHRFHVKGQPLWETDIEMRQRLAQEELERRKDPVTLLSAVEQIIKLAQGQGGAEPAKPARATRARKGAGTAAE